MVRAPEERPLRFGVVGAGWVARARYVPCLKSLPGVEATSVFDPDPKRAAALAGTLTRARAESDWSRFLELDLDAVTICTPPRTHAELAIQSLEAGRHVLCEKPMALAPADAQAMITAAANAQRHLSVSHNFLFSRAMKKADALLGPEPRPKYVAAVQFSSRLRRLPSWYEGLPGGLMVDESPHMLYTLQHLVGKLELEHVRARWSPGRSTPDSLEVLLQGERGPAQLTMVFDAPVSEWQVVVADARQVVAIDLFRDIALRIPSDAAHKPQDILRTSGHAITGHIAGVAASGARFSTGRQFWGHRELIDRFAAACRGDGPVPIEPANSLEVVQLTSQILERIGIDPRAANRHEHDLGGSS